MYGIGGIISLDPTKSVSEQELGYMLSAMKIEADMELYKHFFFDKKALVGKVFSASKMKATTKTSRPQGDISVLFVGELYNEEAYDSESYEDFLLKRYRKYGPDDFAIGLNGSFLAVIVDSKDKSVSLVTDHTSSYPMFTTISDGKLYFSSEPKGLLAVQAIPCEPDPFSVMALAYYGFFLGRHSMIKNINQMDYASICRVKNGRVIKKQYWHYSIEPEEDKGTKYYIKQLSPLLCKAVNRRVRTGQGVIALSGGVDSRGILCCMEDPKKVEAFTYTLRTKKTRHKCGDWAVAERIADQLNIRLSIFNVKPCNFIQAMYESIYDSDGAAGFIFENIWDDLKKTTGATYILLGDECLGWATGILSNSQILSKVGIYPVNLLGSFVDLMCEETQGSLLRDFKWRINSFSEGSMTRNPYDHLDELYFNQRLIHYLNPKRNVITKHGIQVRNPWLDYDILNFIRKLPYRHRISKSLFRRTLKRINPELYRIPVSREGETIDYRTQLINREHKDKGISRIIFDENPLFKQFFNPEKIQSLIKEVCNSVNTTPYTKDFDLKTLLPVAVRGKLGAIIHYLIGPSYHLTKLQILLRIMIVAVTLRHLANRGAKQSG